MVSRKKGGASTCLQDWKKFEPRAIKKLQELDDFLLFKMKDYQNDESLIDSQYTDENQKTRDIIEKIFVRKFDAVDFIRYCYAMFNFMQWFAIKNADSAVCINLINEQVANFQPMRNFYNYKGFAVVKKTDSRAFPFSMEYEMFSSFTPVVGGIGGLGGAWESSVDNVLEYLGYKKNDVEDDKMYDQSYYSRNNLFKPIDNLGILVPHNIEVPDDLFNDIQEYLQLSPEERLKFAALVDPQPHQTSSEAPATNPSVLGTSVTLATSPAHEKLETASEAPATNPSVLGTSVTLATSPAHEKLETASAPEAQESEAEAEESEILPVVATAIAAKHVETGDLIDNHEIVDVNSEDKTKKDVSSEQTTNDSSKSPEINKDGTETNIK